jgi:hypothetical protein
MKSACSGPTDGRLGLASPGCRSISLDHELSRLLSVRRLPTIIWDSSRRRRHRSPFVMRRWYISFAIKSLASRLRPPHGFRFTRVDERQFSARYLGRDRKAPTSCRLRDYRGW